LSDLMLTLASFRVFRISTVTPLWLNADRFISENCAYEIQQAIEYSHVHAYKLYICSLTSKYSMCTSICSDF